MNITVTCPVCNEPLDVDVTVVSDSDGDGIYTRHFLSLESYDIDWSGHVGCEEALTIVSPLHTMVNDALPSFPMLDKLDDDINAAALKAASEYDGPEVD